VTNQAQWANDVERFRKIFIFRKCDEIGLISSRIWHELLILEAGAKLYWGRLTQIPIFVTIPKLL
jgi:hypothetical protein